MSYDIGRESQETAYLNFVCTIAENTYDMTSREGIPPGLFSPFMVQWLIAAEDRLKQEM